MSKKTFSAAQRHAVFTVHGGRCYICRDIIDMATFQVDHVLPEWLADSPSRFNEVAHLLGRPADFALDSYENSLPACVRCNNLKRARPWDPSLLVQLWLQRAADTSQRANELEHKMVSQREFARAVSVLQRVAESDQLSSSEKRSLEPLVASFSEWRPQESDQDVVRVTPTYEAPLLKTLSDDGATRVVHGPYGIGGGPSRACEGAAPSCSCGSVYFNGNRCVACGQVADD